MRRGPGLLALVFLVMNLILSEAQAETHGSFSERVRAAMADDARPEKDKKRDANRLPVETLAFFEIDSNQKVLELLPGGGWYTRLLAPALEGTGQLYLAFDGRMPEEVKSARFMKEVKSLPVEVPFEKTDVPGVFSVADFDFGIENLDAILTFRNLHNLDAASRARMNRAVFDALRAGGVYGVIDHTRRHNEPGNDVNRRRLDPVVAIEEIQAAGFVLEASTDLHARPADGLTLEVGDESVTGRTDRFTLKFRKPAK